jgi:hypothetical protein
MTERHDHDTVVVKEGGSNLGTILGAVLVIALLVAVWYFTLGPGGNAGGGSGTDTDTDNSPVPSLQLPSEAPTGS